MPPTNRQLDPEVLTLIREFTCELRGYNEKHDILVEKIDDLRETTAKQGTEITHIKESVDKIEYTLFRGNGTPSVLARLTHLEGVLSKAWGLALGLVTTGAGGLLAYYLGTK